MKRRLFRSIAAAEVLLLASVCEPQLLSPVVAFVASEKPRPARLLRTSASTIAFKDNTGPTTLRASQTAPKIRSHVIGNRVHRPLLSSYNMHNVEPTTKKKKSLLTAAKKGLQNILPTSPLSQKTENVSNGALERKRQRSETARQARQAFRGMPWIVSWPGRAIASGVGKAINKESVKAEVLLRDAEGLMNGDASLKLALGGPISTGRILSQSSSKVNVMGKHSKNIRISFQVLGSRTVGVGRMVASKYAKGAIVELGVDVDERSFKLL